MKITNDMVLFWGSEFSQWYEHEMTIDGVTYNTAEQFMMAMKAKHFGDEEIYQNIMATGEPSRQKALGRKVKNFNVDQWSKVSRAYVRIGNLEKFSDPALKKILLDTGNKTIVEASPYDKVWGIGLGENDPRALDKSQWQGLNWLGEVLMEVRQIIRESEAR